MRPMTDDARGVPARRRALAPALFAVLGSGFALALALAHLLAGRPRGDAAPARRRCASPPEATCGRSRARWPTRASIASPRAFVLAARIAGVDRRLHPGDYRLDPGMSLPALLRALHDGRGRIAAVTIPEGWRIEQIADRLAAAGVCARDDFLPATRDRVPARGTGDPRPQRGGVPLPRDLRPAAADEPGGRDPRDAPAVREGLGRTHRRRPRRRRSRRWRRSRSRASSSARPRRPRSGPSWPPFS